MFDGVMDTALPAYTLGQLERLCVRLSLPTRIVNHQPTFSAAETQSVLPKGCLVQKTVTDQVADKLLAWSGVGDFRLSRRLYKQANQLLGSPRTDEHTLNPPDVDAMAFYGMQPGQVSPFFGPGTPAITELSALFLLDWSNVDTKLCVAISLSLYASLIIPVSGLEALLRTYAIATYPHLAIYTL